MIKFEISNGNLRIFYQNEYEPYSISLVELDEVIDCIVADCRDERIIVKNVSKWTLHLMTTKNLSIEFAREFQEIVKTNCPNNEIDWSQTEKAIIIYDEYRKLRSKVGNKNNDKFSSLKDFNSEAIIKIIKDLKKKHHLN